MKSSVDVKEINTYKIRDFGISKGQHNHSETWNLKNTWPSQREGTYWEVSRPKMSQQHNLSLFQISEDRY